MCKELKIFLFTEINKLFFLKQINLEKCDNEIVASFNKYNYLNYLDK